MINVEFDLCYAKIKETFPDHLDKNLLVPKKATPGSAGYDLVSREYSLIKAGESSVLGTGIILKIPEGYEGQIRSRSGLALKHQVVVLNSPGTIDSDYRGEIKVILFNHGKSEYEISPGDRIAQIVFVRVETTSFKWMNSFEAELDNKRGTKGFGDSGY